MAEFHRFPTLPPSRQRPARLGRPRSLSSMTARSIPSAPTPSLFGRQSVASAATDLFDALEMPDVSELLSRGIPTRIELANMISRTTVDDVQRLPAIHPYVASARGETLIRYMSFVSRPPLECKAPRYRPRTIAVIPRKLGADKCIRCQLRTEHIKCEKHKYLRVGGGFRHSYYYIKKVLDAIEKNQRVDLEDKKQRILLEREREAAKLRAEAEARARADIAAMMAAKAKSKKRRIKTYVRTVTGEVVSQYHFVSEKDYKAMKKDKKKAKKLLGLKDDEKLEDLKSSKNVYEENEQGEVVKVSRKKAKEMERAYRNIKYPPIRNVESVESGIGRSIREGEESRMTRYTVSPSKKVNWEDDISDHSDIKPDVIQLENSRKGRKKGKKRREKVLVPQEELSQWNQQQNMSSSDSDSDENETSKRRRRKHEKRKEKKHRKEERRQRRRKRSFDVGKGEIEETKPRRSSRKEKTDKPKVRDNHREVRSKKKTRKSKKKIISSDSDSSHEPRRRRQKKRKDKPPKSSSGTGEDSGSEYSSEDPYDSETGSESSDNSSSTDSPSSDFTDSESPSDSSSSTSSSPSSSSESSSSGSSEVSDVSDPSSVSDVSDVEGDVNEEQRKTQLAWKKLQKAVMKKTEKKERKIEVRKVEREAKRDVKRVVKTQKKIVKEKKKQEKKERKEVKRQEKKQVRQDARRRKIISSSSGDSSVSDTSVSSVHSDEISDVDPTLDGEEKQRAIEDKKATVKAQKIEEKMTEKKEERKEEQKERKREKHKKKMKKAIAKELERVSSASAASSVRDSELSDMGDLGEEEKDKIMEEKKEEKKVVKMFRKAISRVMKKQFEPEDWVYDDTIDDSSVVRESRKKKEFKYLLPKEVVKSMVKMGKGSRGLTEMIKKTDGRGMEWFDEWQKKREEERLEKERQGKENGIDDEEFQNLLKSAQEKLEKEERKRKKITKRKGNVPNVSVNVGDDSDESETTSEVSEIRPRARKENQGMIKAEGDAPCIEESPELEDPPSSPSELGKIRGVRRVNRLFKENSDVMQSHLKLVLETASELQTDKATVSNNERPKSDNSNKYEIKHTNIDFLSHYRLIEAPKLEPFGRAFVVEDDDQDCCLEYQELRNALDGVQSLSEIRRKQIEYVLKVLDIDVHTRVTFKMFAVVAAVCERMCSMDPFGKYLVDQSDLMDIERKMSLYKAMFYCNINASEHGTNHVSAESIRIELLAGGLSRQQERYVMSRMNVNGNSEISFFDYMAYIPLFLSMHDNIIDNPLDMTEKYHVSTDKGSPFAPRDMNPLGLPLKPEFLDAPNEIYPSGIPLGRPVRQTETVVEPEAQVETETADTASVMLPPSERLPSLSSKPSSATSLGSMNSAGTSLSESRP